MSYYPVSYYPGGPVKIEDQLKWPSTCSRDIGLIWLHFFYKIPDSPRRTSSRRTCCPWWSCTPWSASSSASWSSSRWCWRAPTSPRSLARGDVRTRDVKTMMTTVRPALLVHRYKVFSLTRSQWASATLLCGDIWCRTGNGKWAEYMGCTALFHLLWDILQSPHSRL